MIVFQDVNICVIERPKIGVGELKYLVMGKNYSRFDLDYIQALVSHQFGENRFYVDPLMSKGLDSKPFVILGDDLGKDVLDISNDGLVQDLRGLTIQTLKDNPQWIESGNLTSNEKIQLQGMIESGRI
jgi:hypothetical protein